jgi:hypothetical protein
MRDSGRGFNRTEFGEIHHRRGQHLQAIAACAAARLRKRGLDKQLHVVFGDAAFLAATFDLRNLNTELAREAAYGRAGVGLSACVFGRS